MRKNYVMALERREAVLLTLLDKQVEAKQEMLAEMRFEVAAARSRVLAAKEEGTHIQPCITFFYCLVNSILHPCRHCSASTEPTNCSTLSQTHGPQFRALPQRDVPCTPLYDAAGGPSLLAPRHHRLSSGHTPSARCCPAAPSHAMHTDSTSESKGHLSRVECR